MKVSKLLLVAATLVVSVQSYGGVHFEPKGIDPAKSSFARNILPAETNKSMNLSGALNQNSEECPLKSSAARFAKTAQELAPFHRAKREEVR